MYRNDAKARTSSPQWAWRDEGHRPLPAPRTRPRCEDAHTHTHTGHKRKVTHKRTALPLPPLCAVSASPCPNAVQTYSKAATQQQKRERARTAEHETARGRGHALEVLGAADDEDDVGLAVAADVILNVLCGRRQAGRRGKARTELMDAITTRNAPRFRPPSFLRHPCASAINTIPPVCTGSPERTRQPLPWNSAGCSNGGGHKAAWRAQETTTEAQGTHEQAGNGVGTYCTGRLRRQRHRWGRGGQGRTLHTTLPWALGFWVCDRGSFARDGRCVPMCMQLLYCSRLPSRFACQFRSFFTPTHKNREILHLILLALELPATNLHSIAV